MNNEYCKPLFPTVFACLQYNLPGNHRFADEAFFYHVSFTMHHVLCIEGLGSRAMYKILLDTI